jgi:hypothetical protein
MSIVGGLDIHRKQITFDYLDTATGEVRRGQIAPADRAHLRAWLVRFAGRGDVAFALEGCTGWRYVAEELAAAGVTAHVAEPADTAFARGRKRHVRPRCSAITARSAPPAPPRRAPHLPPPSTAPPARQAEHRRHPRQQIRWSRTDNAPVRGDTARGELPRSSPSRGLLEGVRIDDTDPDPAATRRPSSAT